jgi:hypothetical protein
LPMPTAPRSSRLADQPFASVDDSLATGPHALRHTCLAEPMSPSVAFSDLPARLFLHC